MSNVDMKKEILNAFKKGAIVLGALSFFYMVMKAWVVGDRSAYGVSACECVGDTEALQCRVDYNDGSSEIRSIKTPQFGCDDPDKIEVK